MFLHRGKKKRNIFKRELIESNQGTVFHRLRAATVNNPDPYELPLGKVFSRSPEEEHSTRVILTKEQNRE